MLSRSIRALISAFATALAVTHSGIAQTVQVRDLGPIVATSREKISLVFGVKQFRDGRVLVSDGIKLRLVLFDSTLTTHTVVADTGAMSPFKYGRIAATLIPYVGDTVIFIDFSSQTLLLLGPDGTVARVTAPPKVSDLSYIRFNSPGTDPKGGLIYRGIRRPPPRIPGAPLPAPIDSEPIVRADFETRRVDTLGMLWRPVTPPYSQVQGTDGLISFKSIFTPVSWIDDWTVTSDGAIAIVRSQDYHIDWIDPDGTRRSSPKLPYDWRRLTDEDKQRLVDSAQRAHDANDPGGRGGLTLDEARARNVAQDQLKIVTNADGTRTVPVVYVPVPLKDIPDYVPPIRRGAVTADADGNVWILPTTSAGSRKGGLVYDVINRKGEFAERVEIPAGRSIVGFGPGGAVFLVTGDRTNGFLLERAKFR